ncbi:ABC transporter substrate-binding protein [Pasteurellaceae bacterium 15-036681]|nr:ABC transporter substrate-binding protein [Pasteurellaceae bacterium 15-036681]
MKKIFVTLFSLFISSTVLAHPHSFLEMQNKVLINQGKLDGFKMRWTLDEITSSELLYEVKSAKDKEQALTKITRELDDSAVNAHYFSELYDEKNQPIKFKAKPQDSSVEIKDQNIIYHFTLALAKPVEAKNNTYRLFTFEPSYYLAMNYLNENDVSISEQDICSVKLIEPKVNQNLRLYASSLDKNDSADMPGSGSLSLGGQFAQTVSVACK